MYVHFTSDNEIYKQTDGVATCSQLGPVLVWIITVELEKVMLLKV